MISLSRYRSHLSGFEAQLNDIGVFREPGMVRKAAGISTLSDDIRKRDLRINDLCRQLRGAYLETERILPELSRKIHEQEAVKSDFYKQRDKLDAESKNRTATMEGELAVLKNALSEAEAKRVFYAGKDIQTAMDRCNKLEILQQEQESLVVEKDLLSSKNKEASVLHANLIANLKNELAGFENEKQKQLLAAETEINARREARREYYRRLREELRHAASEEKERLLVDREKRTTEVAALKMRIKTARGQSGTSEELEAVKGRLGNYDANRKDLELKIRELKYELNYQTKEFETAEKHLDEDYQKLAESNEVKIEALSAKLAELTEFLDNQKDSFFNWLSEHKPGWEQTIGQVCDERLLYGKEFTAEVGEGDTFYGIRFTSGIHRNVKTKEDYLTEKKEAEEKRAGIQRFIATEDESRLSALRDQATRLRQEEIRRLEEELNAAEAVLSSIQQEIATLQGKMDRELASLDEQEKDELAALDKELSARREAISEEIARKKAELEERKSGYDREQLDSLTASGGDPRRLEEIHSRLAYIGGEIKYINETKALIIEYLKDKREMLDKVPDWTAESLRLQQIIHGEQEELKKRLADVNRNIFKIDAELKELKEANRKALENREEYHRSTLLDWFTSSFSEDNVFAFKTSFSDDKEYMDFACDLKEFIDEDKVSEYQSRINTRNSDIFRQITADTKSMVSQEGNIRGVVDQINADFKEKNFVGIIQCIEMRIDPSQNKIVNLLKEIKRFNEEYSWDLGQNLFASSADDTATREKATTLLRELIKSMDAYSGNLIRLADFFDLKFRVIENRNDTGFVERLTNVGSEGTDILVKSMVNIMLLNVFKRNASTVFSDFRLHCMMDEIGKLHPNNVAGILKFANDRDILLINGSPTEQDALSYKHIYKLEKDTDSFTRIRRVITQFD